MVKVINGILKLLFPPRCIFCGKISDTESDMYICGECYGKIPFLDGGIVQNTGTPGKDKGCDYVVCVCRYCGMIRDAVKRFKFRDKPGYYRALAALMAEKLKKMTNISEFDIITCVPLHKKKESTRGYNQSMLLAKELGGRLRMPVHSRLLVRQRYTESQSLLHKNERQHNVSGAFRTGGKYNAGGKTILLIDDVMTTGSTLEECGRILREAGAKKVVGAVIATGRHI